MTNRKDDLKNIAEHLIKAEFKRRRDQDKKVKKASLDKNSFNDVSKKIQDKK